MLDNKGIDGKHDTEPKGRDNSNDQLRTSPNVDVVKSILVYFDVKVISKLSKRN